MADIPNNDPPPLKSLLFQGEVHADDRGGQQQDGADLNLEGLGGCLHETVIGDRQLERELRQLVKRERRAAWNDGFLYALRAEEEGRRLAREEIENSG